MELKKILKILDDKFNDDKFKYVDETHTYTYNNDINLLSVTTFVDKFKVEFDREYHSMNAAQREGVSQEEILERWDSKSKRSSDLGSEVHEWIENFYFTKIPTLPTDEGALERVENFIQLYAAGLYKLTFLKSELKIFSVKYGLAGTIDGLFYYKGFIILIDWKTNEKFTTDHNCQYKKLLEPFQDYWENKLNLYSIQLSTYAYLLEQETGLTVKGMYICHFPPAVTDKGEESSYKFKKYMTKDFRPIIHNFLNSSKYKSLKKTFK